VSNSRRPRPAPLSIRFSDSEKALLKARANGIPVSAFIRQAVLGDVLPKRVARGTTVVKDPSALSHLLGLLGRSHLANNLNQLAKAANFGSLPVTEETEADLRQACADVAAMRTLLMQALGFKASLKSSAPLTHAFACHSQRAEAP
jgi:hypothetical protein